MVGFSACHKDVKLNSSAVGCLNEAWNVLETSQAPGAIAGLWGTIHQSHTAYFCCTDEAKINFLYLDRF